jgi:putative IMPACT (imprinted ancient) family translation regulator
VTNTLIIVVRYFGGTLLGVPGLINAYKTAASLALQTTPVVQKPVLVNYTLHFDYTQLNTVMTIIKLYNCIIVKQEIQLFCSIHLAIAKDKLTEVLSRFNDTIDITLTKS